MRSTTTGVGGVPGARGGRDIPPNNMGVPMRHRGSLPLGVGVSRIGHISGGRKGHDLLLSFFLQDYNRQHLGHWTYKVQTNREAVRGEK